MVLSIIAMSGLTVNTAKAAAQAGDLIKMDGLSSVYYLGSDGKRYVFPSESVYFSWYADFSGVVTIPASELQTYPLGSNVTMRPGTKLVKITTDPSVYAVTPNGVLRKIQSEADAIALYGSNWNKIIVDVADSFFTNYTVGSPLPSGTYPAGTLLKNADNASIYYFDGTNYRLIASESAFNANRFSFNNVVTTTMTLTASGSSITGAETFSAPSGGVGSPITGSGLSLALSSQTPMSTSIPKNGVRVPFTKVNLTAASDGNVSINSITVKRIGLSSYNDVDKVWAEYNGNVIASKKSMNSNDEAILVFSPALNIPAGQTLGIDLVASLTGTGTGNIGLAVASASAVSATAASVTGSFPINGNLMSLIAYDVAKLAMTGMNVATSTIKVGDEKVDMGRFELGFNTSGGTAAKDVRLSSITLKNNGVEDLSKTTMNLYLEHAGNKVTSRYTVDGRFVTFFFNEGFDLLKDDGSKLFYVKGDIISKENTGLNSFVLELNKSTDLVAYEKSTGFGVNTYTTNSSTVLADAHQISIRTIEAGNVSISKKSTSPSDTTIVKGTDNVVLIANIRADEQVVADGMKIWYGSDATTATTTNQFENVRVFLNGVLLDSFDPSVSTTTLLTADIDSSISLNKGDNEVRVMVKAKSNATATSAFYAKILGTDVFTGFNAEYVVSGNSVATIGGSATGATFTVQGAALTTVRNDGYGNNKPVVAGSTDISFGKFTVKATNDEVKITSVSFGGNIGSTTATLASAISDMKLYVDGVQVGNTVDFGSSGANFSSLNVNIAKDTTKSLEIKGTIDSSAVTDSYFATVMTINAQDSRGTVISSGNTAQTTQFQVKASGTLTVEVGGDSPVDGLLVSKAMDQEVAQIKLTAVNDVANLSEINISNDEGVDADPRIAAIKLYDGSTLIDQFVPVNGAGKFTIANNTIVVPANGSKTLSVRLSLNNIENDATATNKTFQLQVESVKFKSSAGAEQTVTLDGQGGNPAVLTASTFIIRKTIPTVTYQALPDTLLNAGDKVIAKFTVTADANADVTVGRFTLLTSKTASATLATTTNTLKVNGANKAATAALDSDDLTITLASPEIVAAGTTKTFEVIATVGVSGTGSESITAKIVEDTPFDSLTGALTTDLDGNFAWSDGASISAYTWANGYNVPGLDTQTWTLSKN